MAIKRITPTVSITSEILQGDTGASSTDGITSNGNVTLAGKVTGASGTVVKIYDGTRLVGTATLDNKGGWSFSTVLLEGSHSLRAVAVQPDGSTASATAPQTITVETKAPVVSIASQLLAQDTGSSASDGVTRNGTVTLTGVVSGYAGTTVKVYDGAVYLGTATLDGKGGWSYSTTLADGTHSLHAVATDLAGNSTSTAAQSAIVVDHSLPTVSFSYEYQVVGSSWVQLWGTFTGSPGTKIEVFNGTTDLGAATISGNAWNFTTPDLAVGNYSFTAVATTLAGNSTTFGGLPSLSVGAASGTLDLSRFATVWHQDFTTTEIDHDIFPIVYGNADQFSYSASGLTLSSYRSEGFGNVGILQPTWGPGLSQGYGLYSITASHPANQGTGIAILLWPSDNAWPGPELDMVEDWNDPSSQTAYFSVHFKNPVDGSNMANTVQYAVDLTHPNTFALDWERGSLTYYVDGQAILRLTGSEVPMDFADGGINASFGAQISDIGSSYEPSDVVSLTISDMSYSTVGAPPPSIVVSNPGNLAVTAPGAGVQVTERIAGVSLPGSTVYAMVLNSANVAYVNWQAVQLDASGHGTFAATYHATGDYLAVTTDPSSQAIKGWSAPVTITQASDPGGVLAMSAAHDHVWLVRSGNDLVIDVMGTPQETVINDWYANGQPWQQIDASDGWKIDSGINSLVDAMTGWQTTHPAFDPMTTSRTSLGDSFYTSLSTAFASSWHT